LKGDAGRFLPPGTGTASREEKPLGEKIFVRKAMAFFQGDILTAIGTFGRVLQCEIREQTCTFQLCVSAMEVTERCLAL